MRRAATVDPRTAPSRRRLLRLAAGTGATAALGPWVLARRARAEDKTLRIAQWAHFVPGYDDWFDKTFTRAWGDRNDVRVVVDHYSVAELRSRALSEIASGHGHDLFGFLEPTPSYESHALPVTDVVGECERRFGRLARPVHKATSNPKTKQYFAFSDCWAPMPLNYRTDWWGDVGMKPSTWENIRDGARKIKDRFGIPAGFGLAPEQDSNMALRGLLWSFGAAEQDEAGQVTINSKATVEAIKLMTAIYRESETPEVFLWDPSSNNRLYVWGHGSIIQNAVSALRQAEKQNPDVARRTALARAAAGPAAALAAPNVVHAYVIWKFATHPDLATRFLADLVGASTDAFVASEFYNFPSFTKSVPGLAARLTGDRHTAQVYGVLADAESWTASPGYPGYLTPAVEETFHRAIIPRMFARAARGEQTPSESVQQAEAEMRRIFGRWAR